MSVNRHMVAGRAGRVLIMAPPVASILPADAVELAAWLVAVATVLDPSVDFDAALREVMSS